MVSLRADPLPGPAPAAKTTASAPVIASATSVVAACSRSTTAASAPARPTSSACSGLRISATTWSPRSDSSRLRRNAICPCPPAMATRIASTYRRTSTDRSGVRWRRSRFGTDGGVGTFPGGWSRRRCTRSAESGAAVPTSPTPAGSAHPIPFVAGFESTYLPLHDSDITETTGHDRRWAQDLSELQGYVHHVRYPIRWHRVEAERGRYDWSTTDATMAHLQAVGLSPIVDLLHHTSYPAWLDDGLRDRRFGPAFVRFATAVAERYPWLEAYTLFNEPFSTLQFAGHEGLWPPYDTGLAGMARLVTNVLPALSEAAAAWRELRPAARHVWVDTCEH